MGEGRARVAVFLGGPSTEHDVSLASGRLVLKRLDRTLFEPFAVYVDRDRGWHFADHAGDGSETLEQLGAGPALHPNGHRSALPWIPDFAFLGLHGFYGEDGQVQSELEALDICYTGSGPAASRLAIDKSAAKMVFRKFGLPVARDFTFDPSNSAQGEADRLATIFAGPWAVKPRSGGSSVGVVIARTPGELAAALADAARDGPTLVEAFATGRELTCGVLEDVASGEGRALPPTEIIPRSSQFFDYDAKYTVGASEEITPASLSSEQTAEIQKLALEAHRALGCRGYSRSDFILSVEGGWVLLETNTLPGLTETSLLPQAAAVVGIDYSTLLTQILELARRRTPRSLG